MNIEQLRASGQIIFEGIVGSQAYGISTPTSDVDKKGVFVQPLEDILGFGYVEQISDEKNDTTFYELRRFLQLLQQNNPNILELLNLPEDCILHKDPIFDRVISKRDDFITKVCRYSFGGYAIEQIKKARGLNKKIANPMSEIRKNVLDFCYVFSGQGSLPVKEYLKEKGMKQEYCGLVSVPHMKDTYSVFYDKANELNDKGIELKFVPGERFKGIVSDEETSNEISLSSVPFAIAPTFYMQFNKDGYQSHCRDFKEYWEWDKNKNPARFADNIANGKNYDGKNLAHCHRLLDMAIEIGEGKGIIVRRSNREVLLKIRKGEYEYETLISEAEDKIKRMDSIFENSSLPDNIDKKSVDDLLVSMRKEFYSR